MEALINPSEETNIAEFAERVEELSIAELSTVGGGLAVLFY